MSTKVAGSAVVLILRRGVMLATAGVSTIVVARVLDPTGFGQLQGALAIWAILLTVTDLGFSLTLSRELALKGAPRQAMLRTTFQVQGMWAVGVALAFAAVGFALGSGTRGALYLVLAPSVAATALAAGRVYYMAAFQTKRLVAMDTIVNVGQLVTVLAVALLGGGSVAIAAAMSAGAAANAVWVGLAAQSHARKHGQDEPISKRVTRRGLFWRVLPLGVMGVMSKAYLTIDLALLSWLIASSRHLGDYAGAVKIINLLNTFPGLIMGAALPGLAAVRHDPVQFQQLANRLAHWLVAGILPLFLGVAIFASTAGTLILGGDYTGAAPLITILAASGVVAVASQLFGSTLVAAGVIRPMVVQNALALTVNIVGNVLLVPRYGVAAAAWMTVLTEVIVCAGSFYTLRTIMPMRTLARGSVRAAAPAVVAAVVGLGLSNWPIIGVPAAVLTFAALVIALKSWPAELAPSRIRSLISVPTVLPALPDAAAKS
jgi:O-antigen/teichoic acid export membrane protein